MDSLVRDHTEEAHVSEVVATHLVNPYGPGW
jgi:hypothetical protein